jgi:hypothetical protein
VLSVVTPSVPVRAALLTEARRSVARQYWPPAAHLVRVEKRPATMTAMEHLVHQRNALVEQVATPWFATLDDDDLMLPSHLDAQREAIESDEWDVISTWPVEPRMTPPVWDGSLEQLEAGNRICCTAVVRTEAFRAVGGYRADVDPGFFEDWDLWLRLHRAGARFRLIERRTWHYRQHAGQMTRQA